MTTAVTASQLKAAAPNGNPQIIAAIATTSAAVFAKYGISNINRVWGCLSTFLEESGFNTLFENLNYTARRAHDVWPTEFPTVTDAEPYAGNPQKLANKVYGSRMGNVGPNAGWLYRGQGLEQITGENNFALLKRLTGLDTVAHPEIVTSPEHMLECAVALFVQYPGILAYCDAKAFTHVWALVGTGRATGPVINLANHEAALAAIERAILTLVDVPVASVTIATAPSPVPVAVIGDKPPAAATPATVAAVQAKVGQLTDAPTQSFDARVTIVKKIIAGLNIQPQHEGLLADLEAWIDKRFSFD